MRQEKVASLLSFRCHIGHAITGEVLAAVQQEKLKENLSAALRLLNERCLLCAGKYRELSLEKIADAYGQEAQQALGREAAIQKLLKADWLDPGNDEKAATPQEVTAE
jgi:hypothetical protein